VDGCQSDDDCVAVQYCWCGYHEPCGWAETVFRLALETDDCIQHRDGICPESCLEHQSCPPDCDSININRCCGYCFPDAAACENGSCVDLILHVCE
jgi:hypothetical protein